MTAAVWRDPANSQRTPRRNRRYLLPARQRLNAESDRDICLAPTQSLVGVGVGVFGGSAISGSMQVELVYVHACGRATPFERRRLCRVVRMELHMPAGRTRMSCDPTDYDGMTGCGRQTQRQARKDRVGMQLRSRAGGKLSKESEGQLKFEGIMMNDRCPA
ncbi:hypothetical protein FB451DRAFT_1360350 [Mycena latifolia]|nr:hypothetical protein FB451DRAFT_1360350 [Mycena latifolia]